MIDLSEISSSFLILLRSTGKVFLGVPLGVYVAAASAFAMFRYEKSFKTMVIPCECENVLENKVVVIMNGTTAGGSVLTIEMAKKGARVIFGCENIFNGEGLSSEIKRITENNNVFHHLLDFSSLESCQKFANYVKQRAGAKIDFIICNGPRLYYVNTELTTDGFEAIWQSHFISPIVVIKNLIGLYGSKNIGKAIFVCSESLEEINDVNMDVNVYLSKMKVLPSFKRHTTIRKLYLESMHALWVYATHLIRPKHLTNGKVKVRKDELDQGLRSIVFISDGSVSTNFLPAPDQKNMNTHYRVFESLSLTNSSQQGTQTILHCMQSPVAENLCMMGFSEERHPMHNLEEARKLGSSILEIIENYIS